MTENKNHWYSKAVWNGVEIDLPLVHDLETYGKAVEWREYSKLNDPTAALQSLKFRNVDEDGTAFFTAKFKVPYNSVSDIAYGFFVLAWGEPVSLEAVADGVILEATVIPVCNIVEPNVPMGEPSSTDCWFERAIEAGDPLPAEIILDDDGDGWEDHYCSGQVFEHFVAVQKGDLSPIEHTVNNDEDWFGECLEIEDAEIKEDEVDSVTRLTAPDGSEWRVLQVQHED